MIEVTKYTQVGKGSLIGKFNIRVPKWGGFLIKEMTYFQKGHQRWIGFPNRQFEIEGEKKYLNFNGFEDDKMLKLFQNEVIKALDKYFMENNVSQIQS